MRKFIFLFTTLVCISLSLTYGQNRTITGTITNHDDGVPIPGVNVLVKGTNNGTISDFSGKYSVIIPQGNATLVFSFIGMKTTEVAVGSSNVLDVQLMTQAQEITDIVVTALGIERDKKALGYSIQEVTGDDLTSSKQDNLVNALNGKVAGVQITSTGGAPGQSSRIIVRGINSLSNNANNQPLFVVDGVPIDNSTDGASEGTAGFGMSNRAIDLNPQDIENVTILKGAAATALYGIRAANGAVIVTTKKGKSGKTQVVYDGNMSWDEVSMYPEFQKKYLSGYSGESYYTTNDETYPDHFWTPDWPFHQWGPLADTMSHYYPDPDKYLGTSLPAKQWYDPFKDFYKQGFKYSNSISFSGGDDRSTFYASLSNTSHEGVIPNSKWGRTTAKLSGDIRISERLKVNGSINYINSGGNRIPQENVSDGDGALRQLSYWPSNIPLDPFGNGRGEKPDGTMWSFTPWLSNPLYVCYHHTLTDNVNRMIGNIGLDFEITDWMSLSYRLGNDYYSDQRERIIPGPEGVFGEQVLYSTTMLGEIGETSINSRELNSNLNLRITKDLTQDIGLNLIVGHDMLNQKYNRVNVEGRSFGVPNWFDLNNTTEYVTGSYKRNKRLIGVYGSLEMNYKQLLYLGVTGRNDWTSTLPVENRSFFYPAVNLGFVFTEIVDIPKMTFGKLRASWAQVGKDAAPYSVGVTYTSPDPFPFGGLAGLTRNSSYGDPNLKPETTTSLELGTDIRFFDNRLGIDFTWYKTNSKDQIIPVPIANTSGYSRYITNAGEIQNTGIELMFNAIPVERGDFTWRVTLNFAKNNSEVISIKDDIQNIEFAESDGAYGAYAVIRLIEGQPYGNIYGQGYKRYYENAADEDLDRVEFDRPIVVNANGYPQRDSKYKMLGNSLPDWTMNITNSIEWKGLAFSFLFDTKQGGDLFNSVAVYGVASGTGKITEDRDVKFIFPGVFADGQPNTKEVTKNQNYYRTYYRVVAENYLEDGSWIRLRNISLSYTLDPKLLNKLPIKGATFVLSGYNLWISTDYSGFDPETSMFGAESNAQGFTGVTTPGTKSYSVGLKLTF